MSASKDHILRLLKSGPKTTGEVMELTGYQYRSGSIARDMAELIKRGLVERCDATRGRGQRATYRLVSKEGGEV